jgi:hypothetical protein
MMVCGCNPSYPGSLGGESRSNAGPGKIARPYLLCLPLNPQCPARNVQHMLVKQINEQMSDQTTTASTRIMQNSTTPVSKFTSLLTSTMIWSAYGHPTLSSTQIHAQWGNQRRDPGAIKMKNSDNNSLFPLKVIPSLQLPPSKSGMHLQFTRVDAYISSPLFLLLGSILLCDVTQFIQWKIFWIISRVLCLCICCLGEGGWQI